MTVRICKNDTILLREDFNEIFLKSNWRLAWQEVELCGSADEKKHLSVFLTLVWAFSNRYYLLGSGAKSPVKKGLRVVCSKVERTWAEGALWDIYAVWGARRHLHFHWQLLLELGYPLSLEAFWEAEHGSFPAVSSLPCCYQRQGPVPNDRRGILIA